MTSLEASAPAEVRLSLHRRRDRHDLCRLRRRIERVLNRVPGVAAANVNLATEIAQVDGDDCVTPAAIEAAIAKAGYGTRPAGHSGASGGPRQAAARIGLDPGRRGPDPAAGRADAAAAVRQPRHAAGLAATGAGARRCSSGSARASTAAAWKALRARHRQHGPAGGARHQRRLSASAVYLLLRRRRMRTCTSRRRRSVITLVLLGKWLEARAKRQTTDAIRALHRAAPDRRRACCATASSARCRWRACASATWWWCGPASASPVDGIGGRGRTHVDESLHHRREPAGREASRATA